MKPGALNTTGSHLLFCIAFMVIGGGMMFLGKGDSKIQDAGLGVFTGAFAVASRSMGSTDPTPPPPAPTMATATETKTTKTEPPPEPPPVKPPTGATA